MELKGIPTFRILDYKKAMNFYIDFLGFNIDWEHRFKPDEPVYMQISKCGLILHLSDNKRFQTNSVVYVDAKELDNYCSELSHKKTDFEIPKVLETNWQTKQMEINDPFGNLLRFNEVF